MNSRLLPLVAVIAVLGCRGPDMIGDPCSPGSCDDMSTCVNDPGGDPICMEECTGDICPGGEVCLETERSGSVCWPGGDTAVGDACTGNLGCVRGAICVDGACRASCDPADGSGCSAEQTCGMTSSGRGFCQDPDPEPGDACSGGGDCTDAQTCANDASDTSVCHATCDPDAEPLCGTGETCLGTTGGGGLCWLGGSTAVGDACTGNTECVVGARCVNDGAMTTCRTACVVSDPSCGGGETCQELEGGSDSGYCAADGG